MRHRAATCLSSTGLQLQRRYRSREEWSEIEGPVDERELEPDIASKPVPELGQAPVWEPGRKPVQCMTNKRRHQRQIVRKSWSWGISSRIQCRFRLGDAGKVYLISMGTRMIFRFRSILRKTVVPDSACSIPLRRSSSSVTVSPLI